jgi:glutathione S-transferase
MTYVDIVTALALLQFMVFGFKVARARGRYGIAAPAIAGNEIFERYFRVQQNTLEQLIVFLPALYVFSHSYSPLVAAALGAVYLIGREIYAVTYVKDPKKRELGFLLTVLPTAILIFGGLFGAIRQLK